MGILLAFSHKYAYVYRNGELESRNFLSMNSKEERLRKLRIIERRVAKAASKNPKNIYWIELKDS